MLPYWVIIFCNLAHIMWLSKQQATIETSVFGAEIVAMKHGIETLRGLRYKIRMMGITLSEPTYIYGDNKSQVTNSSRPESTFKKNAIQFDTMQSVNWLQCVRPC